MTDLLTVARELVAEGRSVLPIEKGEKRPALLTWTEYQTRRPTDAELVAWFSGNGRDAIGVVTGAVSGGLVILDFDGDGEDHAAFCQAWRDLAKSRTAITGSGKRHVWLEVDTLPKSGKYITVWGTIEVRAEGNQTLAPPSRHPSGGFYYWADPTAPVKRLPDLVEVVAWLERNRSEPGPRSHHAADTGRVHVRVSDRGAAYAQAALRDELGKLALAIEGERNNTLNTAAFSLGQLIGAGLLDRVEAGSLLLQQALAVGLGEREAVATINSGLDAGEKEPRGIPDNGGRLVIAQPGTRTTAVVLATDPEAPSLPDYVQLTEPLGRDASPWLDAYVDFSREWSPRSFWGFHEACGLWLLSTIAARRVVVHFGRPRFTNLYLLLAGRTTMHAKSTATDIARSMLTECGLDYLLAADEATPASFVRALAGGDLPSNLDDLPEEQRQEARMRLAFCGQQGWYAEEFGSWLASMVRTDGIMADFRGLLRRFDDCPPEYTRSTIARGTEKIDRPYLALIANLTPADLTPVARKGTQLWGDGFLARFVFVTPPRDEILTTPFPKGRRVIPLDLTKPLVQWHQRLGLPRVEIENRLDEDGKPTGEKDVTIAPPEPQECVLADDVWDALHHYNMAVLEVARESDLTDLDGNYGRLHEKALRVAALLASLENDGKIEMRHWARAQEIAERWRLYAHRLYEQVTQLVVSPQAEIEDKILDTVRRWQGTEDYKDGLTGNEIRRFIRGLGRAEVQFYADGLVKLGVLGRHRPAKSDRYFMPPIERQ